MGTSQQILTSVGAGTTPSGPITPVANVAASYGPVSSTVTTSAIDTSAADFIVITVTGYGVVPWTISDSKGNTYTPATLFDASGQNPSVRNYYCAAPTKGTGHTFTLSGGSVFGRLVVTAWSGVKQTSPLDTETGNPGTGIIGSLASGAVVPSASGALLIAGYGGTTGLPAYDGTPAFIGVDAHTAVGGSDYSMGVAYYVQTAAASINSSWNVGTGSPTSIASLTAFKAA